MLFNKILWILPFIFFFLGYQFLNFFFTVGETDVPIVIGKSLNEGSRILSDSKLNLRILSEKEDADLIEGTIIDQSPINQKIKTNQSVYLIVSRKPKPLQMPELRSKYIEEVQKFFSKEGIKIKIYQIDTDSIQGQCICQFPLTDQTINNNVILYKSGTNKKPVIFPDFKGMELEKVLSFLKENDLKASVYSNQTAVYQDKNYIVVDQKPISGTIINISPNMDIQLQVAQRS